MCSAVQRQHSISVIQPPGGSPEYKKSHDLQDYNEPMKCGRSLKNYDLFSLRFSYPLSFQYIQFYIFFILPNELRTVSVSTSIL